MSKHVVDQSINPHKISSCTTNENTKYSSNNKYCHKPYTTNENTKNSSNNKYCYKPYTNDRTSIQNSAWPIKYIDRNIRNFEWTT